MCPEPERPFTSVALIVGKYPDSLTLVRCAGMVRSDNSPFRIEPHRGKVTEHPLKSSTNEHWAVFNECVLGSYFANDPSHFMPEA
jgi:hypothetical protein